MKIYTKVSQNSSEEKREGVELASADMIIRSSLAFN